MVLAEKGVGNLKKLGKLASKARAAAYHPATGRLAVVDTDGLKILEDRYPVRKLTQLKARAYSIEFSPDGKSILIGSSDSIIYRWKFIDYEASWKLMSNKT